tara:strand:- start:1561 stop:2076 length:516 start_codon:yes stop_codon:yes gene_type:complete
MKQLISQIQPYLKLLISVFFIASWLGQVFAQPSAKDTFEVHKEITCGCCVGWIEHMDNHGFTSKISHPKDLNSVKSELGVLPKWQSCHTAVSRDGYIFEGHIPAKFIEAFLSAPPENTLGLAVPGMPLGSPGMEIGQRFTPYDIILMHKDGSSSVFARVQSALDQLTASNQ